ncbi:MAG: hypothetical protein KDK99_17630 [Verrucomicrobiales bacterium]|nr:hypothetical protein [Verrucomicrobiales bacterium]
MPLEANLHELKTHLSAYAREVKKGETVLVCERNVPFAELRPLPSARKGKRRAPGLFKGQIKLGDAFFEADEELTAEFEGEG